MVPPHRARHRRPLRHPDRHRRQHNASLNQEQALNERIYGGATPGADRLWKLNDADWAAAAETMGCEGITVTRPSEMEGALDRAVSSDRAAVIDVKTDIAGIAPRAWD